MFATGTGLYLATNHFSVTTPHRLPVLWIDKIIPFSPVTVWIYISEWIFLPVAYLRCRDLVGLNKYFYSYLALQLTCMVIFLAWPTTYPRELHALNQATTNEWTYYAFNSLRQTDTAANCCPSLHVGGLYLSLAMYVEGKKRDFLFFLIWGMLIAISTLTTKQHYFIDLVAGLGMAWFIHWIFQHHVLYRVAGSPK
jgi:membrane-associated phospholipid phosphatase